MKKSLLAGILILILSNSLSAQVTVTARGIGDAGDRQERDPEVSVSREVTDAGVKLLASYHVPNPDYRRWPIMFMFFVNGRLIETQMTSTELPRPIGLTVGGDVAALPFNYSVVARLMHPNRTFTTIINGAAFANELSSESLNCTVNDAEEVRYTSNNVQTEQDSNNTLLLGISAQSSSSRTISVVGSFSVNGSSISGLANVTKGETSTEESISGTIETSENGAITKIEMTGGSGLSLSCE